jgi:OOP family OmpA-OmpF porin
LAGRAGLGGMTATPTPQRPGPLGRTLLPWLGATALFLGAVPARAEPPPPDFDPFAAEAGLFELGVYGGVFALSGRHEFYEPGVASFRALSDLPPELGLRAAYYPLKYLGAELEGAVIPAATITGPATVWTARAHLVGQLPFWRVRPFVVVGGGALGVASAPEELGSDQDASFHWGLGAKALVTPGVALRLDGRQVLGPSHQAPDRSDLTSHFELLLGASLVLGHSEDQDPDGDRVPAELDRCPGEAGVPPDGCPNLDVDLDGVPLPTDRCPELAGDQADGCLNPDKDGDGVAAEADRCPEVVGVAPDGCPDPDPDHDGKLGGDDRCPNEAAPTADGCPVRDVDGDGLSDGQDRCVDQAEVKNGFEDEDGCPDELPAAVQKFTGAIRGISFPSGSAVISASSYATLDGAAAVLNSYPALSLEVGGHTDNVGAEATNQAISQKRADAVREYLIKKGVAPERVKAVGYGPSQPTAPNTTKEGRAANRRIEFKLLP